MIVVSSAVVLWALAAMVQPPPVAHAEDPPPQIETITVTSTKQTYFYNQGLGKEGGTVYFNSVGGEGARQVITVTMTVTGSMPITLTGAPAFGYNPPPDTSNPWEITYTVEMSAETQSGIVFTVTNAGGFDTAVITFTQDITDPTVEFTDVTPPDYDDGSKWYDPDNLSAGWYFTSTVTDTLSGLALANAFWDHSNDDYDQLTYDPGLLDGHGVFSNVDDDGDGMVMVTLTITDHVGNSASDLVVFNFDNRIPTITSPYICEDSDYLYRADDPITIYYGDKMGGGAQHFTVNGQSDDGGVGLGSVAFSLALGDTPPNQGDLSDWWAEYSATGYNIDSGTITVTVCDLVGNAAYQTFNYIRDTEPPTVVVTCPVTTSAPSWTVRWSGSDPAPASGVKHYDVQYKVGPDGPWQDWYTDTSLTQATFGPDYPVSVKNGQTYYFRALAEDNVSNEGPYTNGEDATTYHAVLKKVFLPILTRPLCWGFETGNFTGWQPGGQLAQSVEMVPHSGRYSALLGKTSYPCTEVPVGSAWMSRTVTVPFIGSRTLSFCYRIYSQDRNRTLSDQYDLFAVYINGSQLHADANRTLDFGCDKLYDSEWQCKGFPLDAYKGQTIEITFHNYNRAPSGNYPERYNTYTYVDDVCVQ